MFGLTIVDIIGTIAVGSLVYSRYRKAKDEQEDKKRLMYTRNDRALLELDEDDTSLPEPEPTALPGSGVNSLQQYSPALSSLSFSPRPASGKGLEKSEVGSMKCETSNAKNFIEPEALADSLSSTRTTHCANIGKPARLKTKPSWLTVLTTFGLLAVAACCFAPRMLNLVGNKPAVASLASSAHSSKPTLVTKPIEEIRCGDRIYSHLPDGVLAEPDDEPDRASWRMVELSISKPNGDAVEAKFFRPLSWLDQAGAVENGIFAISIEELDVAGDAAVLSIGLCPPILPGKGHVVTGTFKHVSNSLVELSIEGSSEKIVCTSGHPIWSVTRQEFVDAGLLDSSDLLSLGTSAYAFVSTVRPIHGVKPVFNIEVNQTHTYLVGTQGVLAHNGGAKNCEADIVRFGSKEEADNSIDANGLHLDTSKNGKFKNVGEAGAVDPTKLGPRNAKDFSHEIRFKMVKGFREWLSGNNINEAPGHPGTYQIPANLVPEFNEFVRGVIARQRK